jgi:hypothetical protein
MASCFPRSLSLPISVNKKLAFGFNFMTRSSDITALQRLVNLRAGFQ